jgi:hypothetical protein
MDFKVFCSPSCGSILRRYCSRRNKLLSTLSVHINSFGKNKCGCNVYILKRELPTKMMDINIGKNKNAKLDLT